MAQDFSTYLKKIILPDSQSHKGQNGKLLLIGGSDLFHAASRWSLDVASKFVDMVFYTSVPLNNELIQEAKGHFWNGIVIGRDEVDAYINEADCILVGPGMEREIETEKIINNLLEHYPTKKFVIDAGALQMVKPQLLNERCILTPHPVEWQTVLEKIEKSANDYQTKTPAEIHGATVLLKGRVDTVLHDDQIILIEGGNAGMTKGGTGDVLAGLVAALYCSHDALTSAVVGSYINKKAGDELYKSVGPFFNASDLVQEIPQTFWRELQAVSH